MADSDGSLHFGQPAEEPGLACTAAGLIRYSDLTGNQVNLADKDGGIWEGVTVDEVSGDRITVRGGQYARFSAGEPAPLEGTREIRLHDIARGFVPPGQPFPVEVIR